MGIPVDRIYKLGFAFSGKDVLMKEIREVKKIPRHIGYAWVLVWMEQIYSFPYAISGSPLFTPRLKV